VSPEVHRAGGNGGKFTVVVADGVSESGLRPLLHDGRSCTCITYSPSSSSRVGSGPSPSRSITCL